MGRDRMRYAVLFALLLIVFAPLVSAQEVGYYPDQGAFLRFLESNASYTVIAGDETWAKAWAYYIDEKLLTIKSHGNDTLVLVGNVQNNELIASLWDRTGLPTEDSFLPSIIVLNNTVLITGSEENIYLTERAFEGLWNPSIGSIAVAILISMVVILIFLLFLSVDESHAGSFYLLSVILFFMWYLTAERPKLTEEFLRYLLQALKFSVGDSPSSPLSAMMGAVFRVVPPIEENMILVHWILVLLILSFSFYLAPKRSRELGFIAFGLAFVAPMFRRSLENVSGSAFGLAAFLIVLAIISNVTFSPERWKALVQTFLLSVFTLLAIGVNPYLVLIPIAFVIAFPKRYLRNYTYLLITAAGVLIMYLEFGIPVRISNGTTPESLSMIKTFLMESALAVVSVLYAIGSKKSIKMKGQTAFLLLMTLIYLPIALFVPNLFPYCFVLLAALTVRLLHSLSS